MPRSANGAKSKNPNARALSRRAGSQTHDIRINNLISDSEDEVEEIEETEDDSILRDIAEVSREIPEEGISMELDVMQPYHAQADRLGNTSPATTRRSPYEERRRRTSTSPVSAESRSASPYDKLAPRPITSIRRLPILAGDWREQPRNETQSSSQEKEAQSGTMTMADPDNGDMWLPQSFPLPSALSQPRLPISSSPCADASRSPDQRYEPGPSVSNEQDIRPVHPLFATTKAMFSMAESAGRAIRGLPSRYMTDQQGTAVKTGQDERCSCVSSQGVKAEQDGSQSNPMIIDLDPDKPEPSSSGPPPTFSTTITSTNTTDAGGPIVEEKIVLSEEQERVLQVAMRGESMFFTGSAGTGKSVLLRALIQAMRHTPAHHSDGSYRTRKVAVTASTGIAGLNVGGCTLHAWAGVGLGEEPAHILYKKILLRGIARGGSKSIKLKVPGSSKSKSRFGGRAGQLEDVQMGSALARWLMDDVLIIDEISMIDGRFFDKLEQVGRMIRGSSEPFGGIQVILCGDFFQLPPVPDRHTKTSVFAFQAESWETCVPNMFMLKKVFRQKNQTFADMLNEARLGVCSPRLSRRFASLERVVQYNDGIQATELFPLRYQAENANQARMRELPGEVINYHSIDIPGQQADGSLYPFEEAVKLLDQHSRAPRSMELKEGAQVMLTTNLSPTLANGSLGKIIGFEVAAAKLDKHGFPEEEEGFAKLKKALLPEPKVAQLGTKWPVFEFAGGMQLVIPSHEFDVMSVTGQMEARRVQVPLILAWALSIHKAQGITLPRMKVDLEKIFEKGQAYVALSRATSMDTLELQHFKPSKIYAHPAVIEWSKTLSACESQEMR